MYQQSHAPFKPVRGTENNTDIESQVNWLVSCSWEGSYEIHSSQTEKCIFGDLKTLGYRIFLAETSESQDTTTLDTKEQKKKNINDTYSCICGWNNTKM